MPSYDYDLMVIGSGPAGQRAAIQAAKLDKRVAIIERKTVLGGVSVNTGTIPSKTFREAVLDLSGFRERSFYGMSYTVKQNITIEDLLLRTDQVIRHEIDLVRHQLTRNRVDLIAATASFHDAHTVILDYVDGRGERLVTRPTSLSRPVPKRRWIRTSRSTAGGSSPAMTSSGLIACREPSWSWAPAWSAASTRVCSPRSAFASRLIDRRPRLLPFVDAEIVDSLTYHLREARVTMRLSEEVSSIEPIHDEHGDRVKIHLASGKQVIAEKALYSIGRTGNTSKLNLTAAGLPADDRGRLKVNEHYQTEVPHIYAVGDVIGFPSLASTSMEQGRLAACHAFHRRCEGCTRTVSLRNLHDP